MMKEGGALWWAATLKSPEEMQNTKSLKVSLSHIAHCPLGCFINDTLQKKKMQYQYAPLTGVYKPDMKEFFS